jgi:hypothetical protein
VVSLVCCAELLYAWGRGPAEDWPRVILDAADTTRRLGFEYYLWVDRLCIDQSNPAEKQYPISKMASICEGAELTIVAAAGSDAKYALPGVGTTPRQPRSKIQLQSRSILISTLQDPRGQTLAPNGLLVDGHIKEASSQAGNLSSRTTKPIGDVKDTLPVAALRLCTRAEMTQTTGSHCKARHVMP